ncbi:nicotinate phosphoribosyltransferase [Bifidobacterium crudilactis]|jgi:nicotinate phosphoribosyltransferase|uniref:nicotinate phosphoribosyltransferase n=1 Tax=Bifidobacterium crudilactis TaxID=327277 RepID=UPI002352F094|nr:nicotinate phosphoribosyltransferase [Bifidobacterium crudilactis]MCI1217297.1 nicotinate phosphoribosyltransferase [Bifidobacterium crudilactis]MCI1637441.1 nicotinate phosphoribosyltransferase [Bifidobacterium crudilactis]MDN5971760.1 nicotinate phosphoribosyltransferase [Bifidobacterium crudilactis]MDN6000246.1 nicotinate phosphoribosyltransferase [Bifidobacterium crudilactis]MDN6466897.1 nicotinate phosphoribosyltransferase [Bifidobacterium crudilactis]
MSDGTARGSAYPSEDYSYPTALMTDMYEYTMLDAALQDGTASRRCVFEVFTRHLPAGRRYGVAAGQGRILDALESFHLGEEDLRFLSDQGIVSPGTISWLERFSFSGSIRGYREGEMFFPNSPILQVEGSFAECTLLETLILSILNYDSAVASAASRMASAANGRPCMDMGGRRTNEWSAVAASRAAVVGGFQGTANLLAAKLYGLKPIGTAAHCFTLLHDSERDAFTSQIQALGIDTTLLTDTYDIEQAVRTAVEVAGPELGGVRIDSGDLASLAQRVRNQLDALGATTTKITVTNDLDEYALASLQTAPVDSYGVGTMLVTGSGAPTCAMVYKLSEREGSDGAMVPVAKKSPDKATVPGRKLAYRSYEYGLADCEHVISGSEEQLAAFAPDEGWKNLLVQYMDGGKPDPRYQGHEAITAAHAYRAKALSELPITAQSLMKGDPVIPTEVLNL